MTCKARSSRQKCIGRLSLTGSFASTMEKTVAALVVEESFQAATYPCTIRSIIADREYIFNPYKIRKTNVTSYIQACKRQK